MRMFVIFIIEVYRRRLTEIILRKRGVAVAEVGDIGNDVGGC